MGDKTDKRLNGKADNRQKSDGLPDKEFSASTYGAAADAVAEVRAAVDRLGAAMREGRI
ncbi:MAG: hypothetical protein L0I76_08475 [Pseudonocardia sp.]|nr:hypothetical protein [Pseudonocardia sp.]